MIKIKYGIILFLFILVNTVHGETAMPDTEQSYLKLVIQMNFSNAKSVADRMTKDPSNCRASARFWLGTEAFAKGDFNMAEKFFKDGLELKKKFGTPKYWIKFGAGKTGWSSPEEMLGFIIRSKNLKPVNPQYRQIITYLVISNTDSEPGNLPGGKHIQMTMDPYLAAHGLLSLKVLKRYLELFSNGLLSVEINRVDISQTVKELDKTNLPMISGLDPWNETLSLQMNRIVSESDLIFIAFPRAGGNASASIGDITIVPKLINSPYRTFIKMPSNWLTMINFPQIFHEYMHTVEYEMIRSGMKDFHATSHGSDVERVVAITHIPAEKTGETDWAEYFFTNTIPSLAGELEKKNNRPGYEQIFGIHIANKNNISESTIKHLSAFVIKYGLDEVVKKKKDSRAMMDSAYTAYNKDKNPALAAKRSLDAFEMYPFESSYYGKTKWFIDFSRLRKEGKEEMLLRLNSKAQEIGVYKNE